MNTEQKLLVALLGNAAESEVEPLFAENFDWEVCKQIARQHRLVSYIFPKLRRFSAAIPPEIYREWQRRAKNVMLRNLNFNARLLKLADLFEKNNVAYLSYKGATLARLAYGDSALRQFGDLDFLIYKEDFPKVKKLINENGGAPDWDLSEKQERAVLRHYYEYPFVFGESEVAVEIHWAFMESFFGFDYDTKEVFRRSQKVSIHTKEIRTLSNEDLLLILCVHGSKHFWKRLSWICDVGRLVENQPINWDSVSELAADYGCRRMLYLGLELAKDFTKIELPSEIERQIKSDKEIEYLAAELKKNLFDDDFSPDVPHPRLHLKMRERWRDKFKYSRRLLLTKTVDSLFMPMGRPQ